MIVSRLALVDHDLLAYHVFQVSPDPTEPHRNRIH